MSWHDSFPGPPPFGEEGLGWSPIPCQGPWSPPEIDNIRLPHSSGCLLCCSRKGTHRWWENCLSPNISNFQNPCRLTWGCQHLTQDVWEKCYQHDLSLLWGHRTQICQVPQDRTRETSYPGPAPQTLLTRLIMEIYSKPDPWNPQLSYMIHLQVPGQIHLLLVLTALLDSGKASNFIDKTVTQALRILL